MTQSTVRRHTRPPGAWFSAPSAPYVRARAGSQARKRHRAVTSTKPRTSNGLSTLSERPGIVAGRAALLDVAQNRRHIINDVRTPPPPDENLLSRNDINNCVCTLTRGGRRA